MSDTHRNIHPEPLIVPTVIAAKGAQWGAETQKVAATDAQRILEALVAEYGIDAAVAALNNHGFRGDAYRYLLGPLHDEAMRRRSRAGQPRPHAS